MLPSSVVTVARWSGACDAQATCSIVGWVKRRVHVGRLIGAEDMPPPGIRTAPRIRSVFDEPAGSVLGRLPLEREGP